MRTVQRTRVDTLLVERGLFASRERARAAVIAGDVRVDDQVVLKPGTSVLPDCRIDVTPRQRFVSRGGEKLDGALAEFGIDVCGLRVIDVGASTGGFTDCVLQRGAASVTALDVGYGQLAWSLRTDPRVTVIERTNVRKVEPEDVGAPFDLAVADVSFISLRTVIGHLAALVRGTEGQLLMLVKPQFEAGKGHVGKRGVVRDASVHERVLNDVLVAVREAGLVVRGLTFSPITGPEGNIEFWAWASHSGDDADISPAAVVAQAHERLKG